MTEMQILAKFMKTGHFLGIGIGSTIGDVEEALSFDFAEERDDFNWLRRDYGLIELTFRYTNEWQVNNAALEIHRLASDVGLLEEWREKGLRLEKYTTWKSLKSAHSHLAGQQGITRIEQGEFVEFRAPDTKVSTMVVANQEDRGEWPGDGDLWSMHLG